MSLPARLFDPETSQRAATEVMRGNGTLVGLIRAAIERDGPLTHTEIADRVRRVDGSRWLPQTIVSACARADLAIYDTVKNERGRDVHRWTLT